MQLPQSGVEILMPLQYVIIQHFESKTRGWVTCVDLGNVKQRADVILKGGDHRRPDGFSWIIDREFCFQDAVS